MSGVTEDFGGKIGRTVADSEAWWPEPNTPPDGAPNVVIILFDDTGFSHFGCYGSSIETPNIDRLAASGLKYTNFHTTALCSPTRASLLTGRNHHSVGMRAVSNFDSGFPHMRGYIPASAATLAEMLRGRGYGTFASGKWHLAPMEQCSAAGPFDHWPLQRGFDRFYGFLQGETDQFHPELTYDNHHVDPPAADDYHVSEDLIDRSIGFIRDQKSLLPERPFFLYTGFGATHAPHQAPQDYLDKYRGRFDEGWDVWRQRWYERQLAEGVIPPGTELAPLNPGVVPWDELGENEKKFALRLQEAFAAFLDHTDAQIGRLMDFLESIDELDNTIFMVMSDNGASQEGGATGVFDEFRWFNGIPEDVDEAVERLDEIGGPRSHTNYPWGWAQVGNTPLKRYKQNTHGGGVRDPLVIHWPDGIAAGGTRHQFHHVTDIVPTVLEAIGIEAPAAVAGVDQMPVHGTSLLYTFDEPEAATKKTTQYFEMFGHRGIWHEGWKAVAWHRSGTSFDDDVWELYHVDEDFSECHDLASERPDKLAELIDRWWSEAETHGVLPLDDRLQELFGSSRRPGTPHDRRTYVYYPPVSHVPSDAAPTLGNRSFTVTAHVTIPEGGAEGVLYATGTMNSGMTLFVKDGRLHFDYNWFTHHSVATSEIEIPTGDCTLGVRFARDGNRGVIAVTIDGEAVGAVTAPRIMRMVSSIGMDVGRNPLSPVSSAYEAPYEFTGRIEKVIFDLPPRSPEAEAETRELEQRFELARE